MSVHNYDRHPEFGSHNFNGMCQWPERIWRNPMYPKIICMHFVLKSNPAIYISKSKFSLIHKTQTTLATCHNVHCRERPGYVIITFIPVRIMKYVIDLSSHSNMVKLFILCWNSFLLDLNCKRKNKNWFYNVRVSNKHIMR